MSRLRYHAEAEIEGHDELGRRIASTIRHAEYRGVIVKAAATSALLRVAAAADSASALSVVVDAPAPPQ